MTVILGNMFAKVGMEARIKLLFITPLIWMLLLIMVGILTQEGWVTQIPFGVLCIIGGVGMIFCDRIVDKIMDLEKSDGDGGEMVIWGMIFLMVGILTLCTGGHLSGGID